MIQVYPYSRNPPYVGIYKTIYIYIDMPETQDGTSNHICIHREKEKKRISMIENITANLIPVVS